MAVSTGAVSDALRATRFGKLNYDKNWLEAGKVQDVLALCNRFDQVLNLNFEEERLIRTSPRSNSSIKKENSGLGGGSDLESRTASHAETTADEENTIQSKTSETPSSDILSATESGKSSVSSNDKRGENLSGFELAALRLENEWEDRLKMTVDHRLKLLRNQWEECQKRVTSSTPTMSPLHSPTRSLSPNVFVSPVSAANITPGFIGASAQMFPTPTVDYRTPEVENTDSIISPPPLSSDGQQYQTPVSDDDEPQPVPALPVAQKSTSSFRAPDVEELNEEDFVETAVSHSGPIIEEPISPIVTQQSRLPQMDTRVATTAQVIPVAPAPIATAAAIQPQKDEVINVDQPMDDQPGPAVPSIPLSTSDIARFPSNKRLNDYKRRIADFQHQKEEYEEFQKRMAAGFGSKTADRLTKGIRQELTLFITTTINQLSKTTVKENLTRLGQLLNGDTLEFRSNRISIKRHPDAKMFCCELIARTLVKKQAENVVSVQLEMAYPLAAIAIGLWVEFPEVGAFLETLINMNCQYLIPYYVPRDESDTDAEYYIKQGYQRDEKQALFIKRMSGICRFWAAMFCTPAVSWKNYLDSARRTMQSTVQHPMDFDKAWTFLVNLVQLAPRVDITATILLEYLGITSHFLKTAYGRQFEKLLNAINRYYLPEIATISTGGVGSTSFGNLKTFFNSGSKRFALPIDYPRNWRR